jgi:phosphatidylserine decarboxylase
VRLLYPVLRFLPLLFFSSLTGAASRVYLPRPLRWLTYTAFCYLYGVNKEEAEKDIIEYDTFGGFFTRNLKQGVRSIGEGVVSPVDGRLLEFGDIRDGQVIQAKGLEYTLVDLFASKEYGTYYSDMFATGSFASFYLAPGDYHHIHAPVSGEIIERIYIPGGLLPVSLAAVQSIPSLYCTNERVVTLLSSSEGHVAVIKVGATNVGSIGLEYEDDFHTLSREKKLLRKVNRCNSPVRLVRGARLGTFYLGSTVIILLQKKHVFAADLHKQVRVQFGQNIA